MLKASPTFETVSLTDLGHARTTVSVTVWTTSLTPSTASDTVSVAEVTVPMTWGLELLELVAEVGAGPLHLVVDGV